MALHARSPISDTIHMCASSNFAAENVQPNSSIYCKVVYRIPSFGGRPGELSVRE